MAIDFRTGANSQAAHEFARAIKHEVERELRAALQPMVDKIVQDALCAITRNLHAGLTENTDRFGMTHMTMLHVDGVEKMSLP
jgi:2,3-bisphosphoglycerate-independent phosphoglycerate mutase